jgi:hypothetical protein
MDKSPLSGLRAHYKSISEFFHEVSLARIDAQRSRHGLSTSAQERGQFFSGGKSADIPGESDTVVDAAAEAI